jgi:hypothetical protein
VHPNIANVYRKNVGRFTEALTDPDGGREAVEALRSLIGEIVLNPGKKRGEVLAELRGELIGILEFSNNQESQRTNRLMPAVAARPRNHPNSRKPVLVAGTFVFPIVAARFAFRISSRMISIVSVAPPFKIKSSSVSSSRSISVLSCDGFIAFIRLPGLFSNELSNSAHRTSMIPDHCAPSHALPCLAGKWPSQNNGDEGLGRSGRRRTLRLLNQARDGDDNIAMLNRRDRNRVA